MPGGKERDGCGANSSAGSGPLQNWALPLSFRGTWRSRVVTTAFDTLACENPTSALRCAVAEQRRRRGQERHMQCLTRSSKQATGTGVWRRLAAHVREANLDGACG